jgi:hypothetical protein
LAACWRRNPWPKWLAALVLAQQVKPCEKPVERLPVKSPPVFWVELPVAQQHPEQWRQHAHHPQHQGCSQSLKKQAVAVFLL